MTIPRHFLKARHLWVVAALAWQCATAQAMETAPSGRHCALRKPPSNAGETEEFRPYLPREMNTILVYPRAGTINENFDGCQVVWAQRRKSERGGVEWYVRTVIEFHHGQVVRIWTPWFPSNPANECRFEQGQVLIGQPEDCEKNVEQFPIKTMAPGCTRALHQAHFKPSVQWIRRCTPLE